MRIFITGASGYVGSVVTELAIKQGHEVIGLARSEASANKLKSMGATPLRATLQDTDILQKAAKEADAVLHLGFVHEFDRPYEELIAIDIAAIETMCKSLVGTNKPFIMTSGTGISKADNGNETNEDSPLIEGPIAARGRAEQAAIAFAKQGVRAIAMRLAPYVYGRGGSYFAPNYIQSSAKVGFAPYVDEGTIMTSTCDVDSAAELYLLAMEHGKAGSIFNCTTESDVRIIDLAKTVAKLLDIPTKSVTVEKVNEICGPFSGRFVYVENRASNGKARRELNWNPKAKLGMLDDITIGSYKPLVDQLKAKMTTVT